MATLLGRTAVLSILLVVVLAGQAGGQTPTGPANGQTATGPANGQTPTGPANGQTPTGPANGQTPTGPANGQTPTGPELWTVQTVALRDLREAQSAVAALRASGFDAFTEFAMDGGLQFVRVRVGCYTTRYAAEAMADALRGRVTSNAVVSEATPGAPVRGCVNLDVGFLKPVTWDEVKELSLAPAFRVVVSGIEAHVAHDGHGWLVLQDGEEVPTVSAELPSERFSQVAVGGVRFVRLDSAGGTILCPGTLVNSVGSVAIAEQLDAVIACSLAPRGDR